jgi:hypothetical protein
VSGSRRFVAYLSALSGACSASFVFVRLTLGDPKAAAVISMGIGVLSLCVIMIIERHETTRARLGHPEYQVTRALEKTIGMGTYSSRKPEIAAGIRADARRMLKEAGQNPLLAKLFARDGDDASRLTGLPVDDLAKKRSG